MTKNKNKKQKIVEIVPVEVQKSFRNRTKKNKNQKVAQKNGEVKITKVGQGLRNLGGFVGNMFGVKRLGRAAGAAVSQIFGQGDYVVNAPLQNTVMSSAGSVPSFGDPTSQGYRIRHREFVADIKSSVDFTSRTYALNPGLSVTFPWLSTVAANFEMYRMHGAALCLNTTSGAAVSGTNTGLGLWGLVTQYDPTEPAFTTKQQCENYAGCQTAVPSQSIMHGIECAPKSTVLDNMMYVRTGDVANSDSPDKKWYDWGKTQVFTTGSQNENVIGELWIVYDVEFFKPRLPTGGYQSSMDRYYIVNGCSGTNPLTTGVVQPYNGSNIGTYLDGANNRLVFPTSCPPGTYLVSFVWTSSSSVTVSSMLAGTTNLDNAELFNGNSTSFMTSPQPAVSTRVWMMTKSVIRKASGAVSYISPTVTGLASGSALDCYVALVNPAFTAKAEAPRLNGSDINLLKTLLKNISTKEELKSLIESEESPIDDMRIVSEIGLSHDVI